MRLVSAEFPMYIFVMTRLRIKILHLLVSAVFTTGFAGFPLMTHVCSVMGTLPPMADCVMEMEEESACCAAVAHDLPPELPVLAPQECCHDVDHTRVVDTVSRTSSDPGNSLVSITSLHALIGITTTDLRERCCCTPDDGSPPGPAPGPVFLRTLLI